MKKQYQDEIIDVDTLSDQEKQDLIDRLEEDIDEYCDYVDTVTSKKYTNHLRGCEY